MDTFVSIIAGIVAVVGFILLWVLYLALAIGIPTVVIVLILKAFGVL